MSMPLMLAYHIDLDRVFSLFLSWTLGWFAGMALYRPFLMLTILVSLFIDKRRNRD